MALSKNLVRVAGTGGVWVAPQDEDMPEDLTTLTTPWVELGYITTDGCTFTMSRESTDLNAWQGDKIRVMTTAEPMTVEFALMETSSAVLQAAFGGGTVTEDAGPPVISTYTPPPSGTNTERAMVIEFTDGEISAGVERKYRYCIPRVQIEGDVSWQLLRTDSVNYPLTFGVLDAAPKFTIVTNDSAAIAEPALFVAGAAAPVDDPEYADA